MAARAKSLIWGKVGAWRAMPCALITIFGLLITGCAVQQTPPITRIALLAPFEGRYREVGYQALYAARLAIADANRPQLMLYAVDDGGSRHSATSRANALSQDPLIAAVMVSGPYSTDPTTTDAFRADLPIIPIGMWHAQAPTPPAEITDLATLTEPFTCGDICLLSAYPLLAEDPTLPSIISTTPPVNPNFRERYLASDAFAPEPLPLAQATYGTTQTTIAIIDGTTPYPLPNGLIHEYRYTPNGTLEHLGEQPRD